MKRSLLACGLCTAMLTIAVFVFMPSGLAKGLFPPAAPQKENVLEALLNLPAPPPPNPLETVRKRDDSFFDPKNPPPDDAPIDDLIDYWIRNAQNASNRSGFYQFKPTQRVVERLLAEEERQPGLVQSVLPVLTDDKRTIDFVKSMYDSTDVPRQTKNQLREWLTMNSGYFSDDLERLASRTRDSGGYVTLDQENNVLALTKHDWERAKPVVDRMYADSSQPVTKVVATWALYKHALEANDAGDTERYRRELMQYVENRNLPEGIRDKANDALTHEADFPGRDDWSFGLWEDETWVRLPRYTGLTTLVMYSPPEKYVSRLTELSTSKNKLTRTAAVRCLIVVLGRLQNDDVIRALLPWIADPNWVEREASDSGRVAVVNYLQTNKMPESVPALVAALDETAKRPVVDYSEFSNSNSANTAANAMRMAASAMNSAVYAENSAGSISSNSNANKALKTKEETYYPLRENAIRALGKQADPRAVPALKRLLASTTLGYQRTELVAAIMACGGYSVAEQVDALEKFARIATEMIAAREAESAYADSNSSPNYNSGYYDRIGRIAQGEELDEALGLMVAGSREPGDDLVRATVARIEQLEAKDPLTARTMRIIITSWKGLAVSAILLNDLKTGKAESGAIVRLLAERKLIKEKLAAEIDAARNGSPIAAGIAACLDDDANAYAAALESKSFETRTAMLGCARLIRAELPIPKVAEDLKSTDALLKSAAELYLESEDSPQARSIVYGQHPGEAKLLGATTFFKGRKEVPTMFADIGSLFASVYDTGYSTPYMMYEGPGSPGGLTKLEERLQKEVKDDADLFGLYAYQDNFVRVFKDRAAFSWEDDPSRYHERILSAEEFNRFKDYLSTHHVSDLKPFLACNNGCGAPRELLMLGKNGGSRVYLRSERTPDFFTGLEKLFSEFRAEPSTIKYALSKEVPGLELLFASDQFDAQSVWKQGSDLRIVVGNKEVLAKVEDEVSQMEEEERDDEDDSGDETAADETQASSPAPEMMSPSQRLRIKREYEGFAWYHVDNGVLGEAADQPAGVEFIPPRDQFDFPPLQEQWKARAAGMEIRAGSTGLFKIAGGKVTKLKDGLYSEPVIAPNGRWLVVNKFDENAGPMTVRYNLVTNREVKVDFDGYENLMARCFVPALGKFLLAAGYFEDRYYERDSDEEVPYQSQRNQFYLLDPETGTMQPVNGEARPLAAQSFRALQPAAKPNEFWAAIPNRAKSETLIGTYDPRLLRFTSVLRLPKINFSSMDMWVDEAENKVYFVYSGHLLRVPLKSTQSK